MNDGVIESLGYLTDANGVRYQSLTEDEEGNIIWDEPASQALLAAANQKK